MVHLHPINVTFKQILVTCYLVSALFSSSVHVKAITNPQNLLFNQSKVTNNLSILYIITDDAAGYTQFIQNVRTVLTDTTSNGIPVLAQQPPSLTPSTVSWLTVLLVVDGRTNITVWLDTSNLYLRGYSRSNGVSWEFSDSSLIPNSRSLRFSGSYTDQRSFARTADVSRQELPLGFLALQNAVRILAATENPPAGPQGPARSLLVLVQMVAEAARINVIANLVRNNWFTPRAVTPRMVGLENGWRRISRAVQSVNQSAATANTLLPNIAVENPALVLTLGQAAAAFGILLLRRERGSSRGSLRTAAVAETASLNGTRVLMNLEYVRVNNIDGESPGDLFGVVRIDDGWFNYTFYNRSSGNPESKGPGGFGTLTDPLYVGGSAISGEDAFAIVVSLFDYDGDASPNDEIAQGEVVWDPLENLNTSASYDLHLQSVVTGRYGNVTVGYAVLGDALSVAVDVVLINGDGESPADVYGSVRASQVLGGSAGVSAMSLFGRSAKESVQVKPQQSIPLTRKIVAASVYAPLKVTVDLWDYDTSSSDDPIGQGSVDFLVKVGTQKSNVFGKYGQVQVSVTCG